MLCVALAAAASGLVPSIDYLVVCDPEHLIFEVRVKDDIGVGVAALRSALCVVESEPLLLDVKQLGEVAGLARLLAL